MLFVDGTARPRLFAWYFSHALALRAACSALSLRSSSARSTGRTNPCSRNTSLMSSSDSAARRKILTTRSCASTNSSTGGPTAGTSSTSKSQNSDDSRNAFTTGNFFADQERGAFNTAFTAASVLASFGISNSLATAPAALPCAVIAPAYAPALALASAPAPTLAPAPATAVNASAALPSFASAGAARCRPNVTPNVMIMTAPSTTITAAATIAFAKRRGIRRPICNSGVGPA
eukprot:CAMPEP_0185832462 /NCGR_PEP_ID=MMETSP1353-20130828/2096_1 /TAXON_ID=1077150 /ORGANISM="Erythrolobus australicus, Strain CCMP3124" /LENGTH=232 /DNA_ID=CAMNT_0028530637 /DNA_START=680 /DNA_END=1374 /DNA_ORIENTATION=+